MKRQIESYKQAIKINPDYADAHYNLGVAYFNLGMNKEAIDSLQTGNKDATLMTQMAHINLGKCAYANLGKYKEAIEAYKQAIRIDPDYALAHYNLGDVYLSSGKDIKIGNRGIANRR